MPKALISVSDKSGVVELAQGLLNLGWEIISTGGTYRCLVEAGLESIIEVSDFTGFPEGLGGRIKTLHPKIFGGTLARPDKPEEQTFMAENGLESIQLVVVNLYPFKAAYENPDNSFDQKVEQIDIGGPSLLRAAGKNYHHCVPVVDPADYGLVLEHWKTHKQFSAEISVSLAAKAFAMTAHYDLMIARAWAEEQGAAQGSGLRYGENPHQKAVLLPDPFTAGPTLTQAVVHQGKALSYNNYMDASAALELALAFEEPFAAIIKHGTPCGAAVGKTLSEAFKKAYEADSISAFGGVIALNRAVDQATAEQIVGFFNEIVLAPEFSPQALEILSQKPNVRVITIRDWNGSRTDYSLRRVRGGTLIQDLDTHQISAEDLSVVTKIAPTDAQQSDLAVAWKLVKMVKSNAIVIVKDGVMIGQGGGQTSRIDSLQIALAQAGASAQGAVLASDAFFPFADGVETAAPAGISAIIQPGGAQRDEVVIQAADKQGISMVLTGQRAFLH